MFDPQNQNMKGAGNSVVTIPTKKSYVLRHLPPNIATAAVDNFIMKKNFLTTNHALISEI